MSGCSNGRFGGVVAIAHPIHITIIRKRQTMTEIGIIKAQSLIVLPSNLKSWGDRNSDQKNMIMVRKLNIIIKRP